LCTTSTWGAVLAQESPADLAGLVVHEVEAERIIGAEQMPMHRKPYARLFAVEVMR
jgi:hypothetical protein